jgi:hypothetical protein
MFASFLVVRFCHVTGLQLSGFPDSSSPCQKVPPPEVTDAFSSIFFNIHYKSNLKPPRKKISIFIWDLIFRKQSRWPWSWSSFIYNSCNHLESMTDSKKRSKNKLSDKDPLPAHPALRDMFIENNFYILIHKPLSMHSRFSQSCAGYLTFKEIVSRSKAFTLIKL